MPSSGFEFIQGILNLVGVIFTAYIGYRLTLYKSRSDEKVQDKVAARNAESEFRDDLIKQLEDAYARHDRQQERIDSKDKRIGELLETIDRMWNERVEMRSDIASLKVEKVVAERRLKELADELHKFERKVFYIAKEDAAPTQGSGS